MEAPKEMRATPKRHRPRLLLAATAVPPKHLAMLAALLLLSLVPASHGLALPRAAAPLSPRLSTSSRSPASANKKGAGTIGDDAYSARPPAICTPRPASLRCDNERGRIAAWTARTWSFESALRAAASASGDSDGDIREDVGGLPSSDEERVVAADKTQASAPGTKTGTEEDGEVNADAIEVEAVRISSSSASAPEEESDSNNSSSSLGGTSSSSPQSQAAAATLRRRAESYASSLSLSALLARLDGRNVRYGPTSSQLELVSLLADELVRERTAVDDMDDDKVGRGGERREGDRRSGRSSGGARSGTSTRRVVVVEGIDDDPTGGFGDPASFRPDSSRRRDQRTGRGPSRRQQRRRRNRQSRGAGGGGGGGDDSLFGEGGWKSVVRDAANVASRAVRPVDRAVSSTLRGVGRGVRDIGDRRRRGRRVVRIGEDGIAEPDWTYVSKGDDDDDDNIDGDDFTWADYAIPFWTPAGPPGRKNGRKKKRARPQQQWRREESVDDGDGTTWERKRIRRPTNGNGRDVRPPPPPSAPSRRRNRRIDDRRRRRPSAASSRRDDDFDSPPGSPVRPPRSGPDHGSEQLILPPASADATPFPSSYGAVDEEGGGGGDEGKRTGGVDERPQPPGGDWSGDVGDERRRGQRPREDGPPRERRASRRRRYGSSGADRTADGRERPIYSVWSDDADEGALFGADGDVIDRLGNRVADAAENFLWGKEEEEESPGRGNRDGRRQGGMKPPAGEKDDGGRAPRPEKRHWRDRLADRLDLAMGVHEEGSYYRSWQDKVDFEETTKVGDEPIDWVMARHKNQRRLGMTPDERREQRENASMGRRRRPSKSGAPFWTQEGHIMSVLFGRTPTGEKLSMEKLFNQPLGVNFCTTVLRSSLQLTMALFTNTCRWASVRGALPQPIVVFFVSAAAICAPKGRRLVTVGITLIAIRTIAEALHGYVYGDEDWEDDHENLHHDADPGWEENEGADVGGGWTRESARRPPPRSRRRSYGRSEDASVAEDWDGDGL